MLLVSFFNTNIQVLKKFTLFPINNILEWIDDERCDVLLAYKNMMLEGVYKDNFKELSRRMQDMGWERNNNQCRQQIEILKRRYDDMQDASKKSGSVLYFKPLRVELNDCFGALKDVRPDAVFSSRKGLKITPT